MKLDEGTKIRRAEITDISLDIDNMENPLPHLDSFLEIVSSDKVGWKVPQPNIQCIKLVLFEQEI